MKKGVFAKRVVLFLASGAMMLQFGGCLNVERLLQFGSTYALGEFLLDNDGLFDLFEDGATN